MSAPDGPAEFYDQLADDYHLIFADWDAALARQQAVLSRLLEDRGVTSGAVIDASCGIGTQAIGLARAGFAVTATDISPLSVQRCSHEAAARGLRITTRVADIRELGVVVGAGYDAVVSFDNALPHLLDDADLRLAASAIRGVLRRGGVALASIRDYDAILRDRPSGDLPRPFTSEGKEGITFQVWDWIAEDRYTVRHFILTAATGGWDVAERRVTYRALTRDALSDALSAAGFGDIVWHMPEDSGFYQPIVVARAR